MTTREEYLTNLIRNHQRRLQKLKEQQALEGMSAEPELLIEIEDIEIKLESLEVELRQLEAPPESEPQTRLGPSESTLSLVGRKLGQFELTEMIGQGGLATVYKAWQPGLNRWVAIKVLHLYEEKILARFEREAQAIGQIRHPNISMVMEYNEDEGWHYIAMEYVAGGTLAHYLQQGPLEWLHAVRLAILIAEALQEAHHFGLIHRDVKPSNILMRRDDWPLLADFGLVRVRNPEEPLTESDVVMGTPAYIPPEQARSEPVTPLADMYALGVVLFEMITGQAPFPYKNATRQVLAHLTEPIPSPRTINPTCPAELEKIILKATEKSLDDRYPDMAALIEALQHVVGSSTMPVRRREFPGTKPLSWPPQGTPTPSPDRTAIIPGQTPPARLYLSDDREVTFDLPEPTSEDGLIIGRTHGQRQADIDLGPHGAEKAGVSRRHARLINRGSTWLIDDLGSLNGTFVNDVRLDPGNPVALKNNDVIRCSLVSLLFSISLDD